MNPTIIAHGIVPMIDPVRIGGMVSEKKPSQLKGGLPPFFTSARRRLTIQKNP